MNPKEVFHNTAYSVQLPYIAGYSLYFKFRVAVKIKMANAREMDELSKKET